jgi:hypothetical protein
VEEADLDPLAHAAAGLPVPDTILHRALTRLTGRLAELAERLRVDYYGPGVGVEGRPDVYRLVVRPHRLSIAPDVYWGVMICDAAPAAGWRAVWSLQAASRRRRLAVVRALPDFFRGYVAAVRAAGLGETESGRALIALARSCRKRFDAVG